MPLDHSLWKQVDEKMLACDPRGRETKAGFLARLKRCARSLPKATVRATVRACAQTSMRSSSPRALRRRTTDALVADADACPTSCISSARGAPAHVRRRDTVARA